MNEIMKTKVSRRDMLTGSGAAITGVAALAVSTQEASALGTKTGLEAKARRKGAPRWGMVMDLRRCIGCRACTVACKAENDVSLGRFRTVVQEKTWGTFPSTKKAFLPLMCNHCSGNEKDGVPPCVKICPQFPGERRTYVAPNGKKIRYRSGGTYKRPDGLIMVDAAQCIGCGKCIKACPYGVRSFNPWVKAGKDPSKQAADKCNMCTHRLEKGIDPSCVNTCQGRARIFGDLNDPNSVVSKLVKEHKLQDYSDDSHNVLLPKEGTRPNVFYIDPDNILKIVYKERKPNNLDHYVDQLP